MRMRGKMLGYGTIGCRFLGIVYTVDLNSIALASSYSPDAVYTVN